MTRLHSSRIVWRNALYITLTSGLTLAACACGGTTQPTVAAGVRASTTSQVVIPGADRFAPFVRVVPRGTAVTFHNGDADAHSVVSVPGAPATFSKTLSSGASWTVTLDSAGLYRYYCSIHARYDPATQQIEGLPNADHPSQPMEGVLVVH